MAIVLQQPGPGRLAEAVAALRQWQHDEAPMQLHPGDLGWYWQFGTEAAAAAVRTWTRDGRVVAVGLLDGDELLRLTTAPDEMRSESLARQLLADLTEPDRGVLPTGEVSVESPTGALVAEVLVEHDWQIGEAWTPLRRDLAAPVADPGVRVETVGPERANVRAAVHQASFGSPLFTVERWRAMAGALPYADARCLVAYDAQNEAVAAVTVWSAGAGKPGLIEPMGVHREHQGHGYGKAISVAAAGALQRMGCSSAMVCTPSSNVGAVATYRAAGYDSLPERRDRTRSA